MKQDPLVGIRILTIDAALRIADAAVAWEESGGDVSTGVRLRLAAIEYRKMRDSLNEMAAQLREYERREE